jgi:glycosyltransferase involved in cell wall biosynthesis
MLCSIIIPTFNRENLLIYTLTSILNQSYRNWECLIVDDCSSDSTITIANEFALIDSRFKIYTRPDYLIKGANSCRNFGYSVSIGTCIQWFDSDDVMPSNYLEEKIKLLFNESCDIVVSNSKYFESDINISSLNKNFQLNNNSNAFDFISGMGWFQTSQALIRKSIIKCNKPFNEELKRNQETEFFIRLLIKNCKIKCCDKTHVFIRKHDSSITGEYSSLSEGKKLLLDWPAYRLIYLTFRNNNSLNLKIKDFFCKYFLRMLIKVDCDFQQFFYIFYFGLTNKLLPIILSTKIFIVRALYRLKF